MGLEVRLHFVNRKAKVLIVDDDHATLDLLRMILQKDKYEVMLATTAEEGLQTLESWNADLVITDLKMPGMDGLEFLSELRDWDTELPVILLSASANLKHLNGASHLATAIISKPFKKDALLKAVRKAMSKDASDPDDEE